MNWSVGIMTVPRRVDDLYKRTLASLSSSGFEKIHTRIDDGVGAYGNWVLLLWRLYLKEPNADKFALFQDDVIAVRGLREYLELWYPERGFLNLITYPDNHDIPHSRGWYPSNQMGRGAQGYVFDRDALLMLLTSRTIAERPLDAHMGRRSIDGAVSEATRATKYMEYVHDPSLLLHVGHMSMLGHPPQPAAPTFPGETYDVQRQMGHVRRLPAR